MVSSKEPLLAIANRLVASAEKHDILLRILGSVAVQYFVNSTANTRPARVKDIDFITNRAYQNEAQRFFMDNGWEIAKELLLLTESRETFSSPSKDFTIDVYYDTVDGSHPINLARRLEKFSPTIPWTDLLVSKLQRKSLRPQDVWDCCVLLTRNQLLEPDYLCELVGNDWTFYTLVKDNLETLKGSCRESADSISEILGLMERCPKSVNWRVRSLLGRRLRWWTEMSDASILKQ